MAHLRRVALDRSVRRAGAGRVLVGGSPLVLLRLTDAGSDLLDRIEAAGAAGVEMNGGATTRALIDRLLDGGIVHPVVSAGRGPTADQVTVVVPVHAPDRDTLLALVAACEGVAGVIVVDDASAEPVGPVTGASVVRRAQNGGPGQARTTGLEHVHTDFVAFVDADVTLPGGWLQGLLPHFADVQVALVAPRVASAGGHGALARYEALRSPLDLGRVPARVRAGTRVSYVPSAAIVCRVAALRDVGGFDPRLRIGEDVDLTWRLDEAGWRVRYEPSVVVRHAPRATLGGWLRQRYRYGTSAGPLAVRHPGALAPVRVSGWSAVSWSALATGMPLVGVGVGGVTTALLARKLRQVPDGPRLALRLAGLGHLHAGRSLASGVTRAWWPLSIAAALVSRRCRRALLLAALVPTLTDWWSSRPDLGPVTYVALRNLDDVAYGTGLAVGAVRARSLDALRPDLTSWPKPSRGRRRAESPTTPTSRRTQMRPNVPQQDDR